MLGVPVFVVRFSCSRSISNTEPHRPETSTVIETIEHQQCLVRGVDSDPGSSVSMSGVSGHAYVMDTTVSSTRVPSIASYVEVSSNVIAHSAFHMFNAGTKASVHNSNMSPELWSYLYYMECGSCRI
uniref:Uncharacterized protein n=1 Tax=Tanacetum cinerariifolium TaxID=118510 RepID=A0A699GXD6_TANCI|nr:hypothetical protein [Tanacetum cinerariifolium]